MNYNFNNTFWDVLKKYFLGRIKKEQFKNLVEKGRKKMMDKL